jgi:uncharacterized protein (DUF1778 family)
MPKDKRQELRISSQDDDLIVEAAGLVGVSVSEFLIDCALQDAEELVEAHRSIRLQFDPYQRFLVALDRPAQAPQELLKQIKASRPIKHGSFKG